MGQVLAGPNFEDECVLTAELDMQDSARGKFDFDAAGHYARPGVFKLVVNEKALQPPSANLRRRAPAGGRGRDDALFIAGTYNSDDRAGLLVKRPASP